MNLLRIKTKLGSDKLSINKKAAVQQVFIYMMAIIVVGAIMLIGYKSIGDIFDQKCKVDFIDFRGNLKEALDLHSNYGSFEEIGLDAPCDYDEICFLNEQITNQKINNIYVSATDNVAYKAIKQARLAGDQTNVYIIDGDFSEPLMNYEGLIVDNYGEEFLCVDARGSKFNLNLEGVSRGKVKVSDSLNPEDRVVDLT